MQRDVLERKRAVEESNNNFAILKDKGLPGSSPISMPDQRVVLSSRQINYNYEGRSPEMKNFLPTLEVFCSQ
ncbi:MAG TPA: hypothetical protein VN368_03655 [Candidatus Methylomirabilis sp.]|nr:hypothetical protein [Candidatus Methylomirabilis sp.]